MENKVSQFKVATDSECRYTPVLLTLLEH